MASALELEPAVCDEQERTPGRQVVRPSSRFSTTSERRGYLTNVFLYFASENGHLQLALGPGIAVAVAFALFWLQDSGPRISRVLFTQLCLQPRMLVTELTAARKRRPSFLFAVVAVSLRDACLRCSRCNQSLRPSLPLTSPAAANGRPFAFKWRMRCH